MALRFRFRPIRGKRWVSVWGQGAVCSARLRLWYHLPKQHMPPATQPKPKYKLQGYAPPRCTGEHRGNVAPGTGENFSSTGKVPASVYYYQKPSLQAATSGAAIIPASFFVFFLRMLDFFKKTIDAFFLIVLKTVENKIKCHLGGYQRPLEAAQGPGLMISLMGGRISRSPQLGEGRIAVIRDAELSSDPGSDH